MGQRFHETFDNDRQEPTSRIRKRQKDTGAGQEGRECNHSFEPSN